MLLRWILATLFILSFCAGTSLIMIPFSVSIAGFWPAVAVIIFSWVYLLITGFYYLEATLAAPKGANVYSISKRYMGTGMSWFSSVVFALVNYGYFIFFFYLTTPILNEMLFHLGIGFTPFVILLILALFLGICLFAGLTFSIAINVPLFIWILAVLVFIFQAGVETATAENLKEFHLGLLALVIPTVINAMYYNTILPTLAPFLRFSRKALTSSVFVALSIAALFFIAWLWLAIATEDSVSQLGLTKLNPQSISYSSLNSIPFYGKWLPALLCLSLVVGTIAAGNVLVDFFADIFGIQLNERKGLKRLGICVLVIIPPFLLNIAPQQWLYNTTLYITEIGPLYLAGLLPILWIWTLRYAMHDPIQPLVFGGKMMLFLFTVLASFIFYLVALEIFYQVTF